MHWCVRGRRACRQRGGRMHMAANKRPRRMPFCRHSGMHTCRRSSVGGVKLCTTVEGDPRWRRALCVMRYRESPLCSRLAAFKLSILHRQCKYACTSDEILDTHAHAQECTRASTTRTTHTARKARWNTCTPATASTCTHIRMRTARAAHEARACYVRPNY